MPDYLGPSKWRRVEVPMCPEGKHNPFHRGILGGWKCAECGANQYDSREPWIPATTMEKVDD